MFGKNKNDDRSTQSSFANAAASSTTDWSDIQSIRGEWPRQQLNTERDRRSWREGLTVYQNDDYYSMMRCAELLAPALAHSLYGEDILEDSDLPETAFKLLYCSLEKPPDGRTFADHAQKAARLALTVIRENRWQPPTMGGTVDFFVPLLTDRGNQLLLGMAIGPEGRPWEGDLKQFFARPLTNLTPDLPAQSVDPHGLINSIHSTMVAAEAGDAASEHYMQGLSLQAAGQLPRALDELTAAANMGVVLAMREAGNVANALDRPGDARFWFERAAEAGDAGAMFNVAVIHFNSGDLATAANFYKQAAEAGEPDGYSALTQMADNRGDEAAEHEWARLGAEAGAPFCMYRHAVNLAVSATDSDTPKLRKAQKFANAAVERGWDDALGIAVNLNMQLGDIGHAKTYAQRTIDLGDQEQIERLVRYGIIEQLGLVVSPPAASGGHVCPNPNCRNYGQPLAQRQCPECWHYAQSA